MWPTASTTFSQPQLCIAAVHCGELISMKDWSLSNHDLQAELKLLPRALSISPCLRRCREGVVTGALKCSPSDQQLRGVRREEGREMWVFPWPTVCLSTCVCVCIQCTWRFARWESDWLLSLFCSSIVPLCSLRCAPHALASTQCGLCQSTVVCCCCLIKLVSATGRPYLKHMAMSVPFTRQLLNA